MSTPVPPLRRCGGAPPAPSDSSVSRSVFLPDGTLVSDRYRVRRRLGCGGMGCVYLAQDTMLDRQVALKQLTGIGAGDEDLWRPALHEARAMAAVQHSGIAAVHDLLAGSPPTLVMEFVDGHPLDRWLDDAPATADVLFVLMAIVAAVAEAHRAGIVHCDLKPANVMVTRDGRPKVLDFGIARLARPATRPRSATGHSGFTPGYAPPEMLRGERPTPASDVYSLGVLAEHVLDACAWHGAPLATERAIRAVAAEAQAARPADRPADAAALLARLRGAARPAPTALRRRRSTMIAGASLVAAGCVGGGWSLVRDAGTGVRRNTPRLAVVARLDPSSAATMSPAAADVLLAHLQGQAGVRVLTEPVPAATGDHEAVLDEARGRGATHVILPTLTRVGGSSLLTVAVFDVRRRRLDRTLTRYGSPDAVPALAAATAAALARDMSAAAAAPGAVRRQPALDDEVLGDYSQALRYLERPDTPGHLGHARRLLEGAIARVPSFARAHAQLGRLSWLEYQATRERRHLADAQRSLLDALSLDADASETRITLALVTRTAGDLGAAERHLQAVLARTADDDYALRLLGEVAADRGDLAAARELIGRALSLQPGVWGHHRALGTVLFEAGRYDEAAASFGRLTTLQPDNAWGYQMLGASHQMHGDTAAAITAYEASLGLRPSAAATTNLATLFYERGEWRLAERRYREAVALQPNNPSMHRNLGDVLLRQSRLPEARQAFADSLRLIEAQLNVERGNARLIGSAAYVSARAGACGPAREFASRAERIAAGNPVVLGAAVNAHVICGAVDDAARILASLAARRAPIARLLELDVLRFAREVPRLAPLVKAG